MTPTTIPEAKALAYEHRACGAAVMTFGSGTFSVSSYGMTRQQCDAMRKIVDQIADLISDGTIRVPEELRKGKVR